MFVIGGIVFGFCMSDKEWNMIEMEIWEFRSEIMSIAMVVVSTEINSDDENPQC